MKFVFLLGLLIGSALCQVTGIVITGGTTTGAVTAGTTGGVITGGTGGIASGVISGVITGSPGVTSGSSDVPPNGYLLFGPIAGPANNIVATFTVTSGAPVDVGIITTTNYAQFQNGATPSFEFTSLNQTNATIPSVTVNSGSSIYYLVGNNLINSTGTGQASTVAYSFNGLSNIGVLAVTSRPTPSTGTTGTTTSAAGSTSGTVNIQPNQYAYWTIPGPFSGASATFAVTSGAPIDILLLVDNNFGLFQNRQTYVSLFRNLTTAGASFLNINIASGSTLYIVIGNALSDLAASSLASVVQYQLAGFPATATLVPVTANRNVTITSTSTTAATTGGVIITGVISTGVTTTGAPVSNTVTINSNQFAQWTITGPVSGGAVSFTVTNGSPIDLLLLVDQNYNLFLNNQPFQRAFQLVNVQNAVASPINLNAGSVLYILVGNNLVTGGNIGTSTVQYTLNGFPSNQISGPTLTNRVAGVITSTTTSTPQPSSGSNVVAQWVLAVLCALGVMMIAF